MASVVLNLHLTQSEWVLTLQVVPLHSCSLGSDPKSAHIAQILELRNVSSKSALRTEWRLLRAHWSTKGGSPVAWLCGNSHYFLLCSSKSCPVATLWKVIRPLEALVGYSLHPHLAGDFQLTKTRLSQDVEIFTVTSSSSSMTTPPPWLPPTVLPAELYLLRHCSSKFLLSPKVGRDRAQSTLGIWAMLCLGQL